MAVLHEDRMAFELAFVLEDDGKGFREFVEAWGYVDRDEEFKLLCEGPQFRAAVERHREEIRRDGLTFRLKSRVHAEQCLPVMQRLVDDVNTPAAVRAKLFGEFVRFGGLDPGAGGAGAGGGQAGGVSVTINMGDAAEMARKVALEAKAAELPGEAIGGARFVPTIPTNE